MGAEENQNEKTISLSDLFRKLWKNKILIAIITAVVFVVGAIYTFVLVKPSYTSKASFIVGLSSSTGNVNSDESYDYLNSLRLVPTVVPLVKEQIVLREVAEAFDVSENALAGMISVYNEENSLLVSVSVKCSNPELSKNLANAVVEKLIEVANTNENLGLIKNTIVQTSTAKTGVYTSPNKTLYLVLFFLGGLVAACIVVFFKEFASNKFKTKNEVESVLGDKIIGYFIDDEAKKIKVKGKSNQSHAHFELLTPGIRNYEPYNTLFTNVKYSCLERPNKVVMITSSHESELKSTIACNLAACIRNNDKRVIVIDLDTRKPAVHKFFKVPKETGLVEFIEGSCGEEDIIKHSDYGVDVITSGKKIPNPLVILEHSQLGKLIEKLKEEYDYVIIDTPPVLVCSDAVIISKLCDGVIFNVTMNDVKKKEAKNALNCLRVVGASIIGLNVTKGAPEENDTRYYSKYKEYNYGTEQPLQPGAAAEEGLREAAITEISASADDGDAKKQ